MDPETVSELHHGVIPEINVDQYKTQMGPPPPLVPPFPSHPSNQCFPSNFHHFQQYPHVFSSDFVNPCTFPMMVDQNVVNNGVSTSLLGGFYNGFHPLKPIIQHRLVNTVRIQKPRRWGSVSTKEARSKRKMVRQRSLNSASSRLGSTLNSSNGCPISGSSSRGLDLSNATNHNNGDNDHIYTFITPDNKRLKIILQKELRNSDVNSLGRIVLPKKDSEAHLPSLTSKEGIQVAIREVQSTKVWFMRYRYWPNNKSRMYVLENTGEFVKQNGLKSGDFVTLYQDEHKQLYISPKKAETPPLAEEPKKEGKECLTAIEEEVKENPTEEEQRPAIADNFNQQAREVDEPCSSSNDIVTEGELFCFDGSVFIDFNDYDWSELDMLPNFEDCDLSLYDDLVNLKGDHNTGNKDNPAAPTTK